MQTNALNCETVKQLARKSLVNDGSGQFPCPLRISRGLS